ncbi:MAG: glycosyltransferase family 39 protein [Chloroflexi bacterium]|nr:glycosyltransferase family 39 protein [Chloroflexota bacterium]
MKTTIFLIPVLLLAFYLRLEELGNWPLRWDEAFSVWEAQMGFLEVTGFTARDVHPPMYFWLLHIWVRLAGTSELAIRALSVFFSQITIVTVYTLILRLSKRERAAWLGVLLITTSPYHIHWSQDARMYALATMFATLVIYAYWRGWTGRFALTGIGAVLSHYFGAIVLGVILLFQVLRRRPLRRGRRRWAAAVAVVVAACIVWGLYTAGLMRKDPSLATFDLDAAFVLMANTFAVNSTTHLGAYTPHVLLITAIFFLGLFLSWRDNREATFFILLGCLVSPIVITILGLPIIPVHVNALQERHVSVFAPFVFAGFGIGLAAMLSRSWFPAGALICVGLLAFNFILVTERARGRYFKDDYRTMMAAVAALTDSNDVVFFASGGRKPLVYYHLDRVGYNVPKSRFAEPLNVIGIPRRSDDVDAMMHQVFAGIHRFWLIEIEAHLDEPLDARINWIDDNYHRIYHIPVAWNGVSLYSSDENDAIPVIETTIPPVVAEARPGDQVRIGVPAGTTVNLVHHGQIIDSHQAETWMLHQFDIYQFYFNGIYELRTEDESYPFVITHSQEFPGGA